MHAHEDKLNWKCFCTLYLSIFPNLQNKVGKIDLYFGVFFNKTIIPHRLVGYEMIIGSWLSFTSLIQYTMAEVGC